MIEQTGKETFKTVPVMNPDFTIAIILKWGSRKYNS